MAAATPPAAGPSWANPNNSTAQVVTMSDDDVNNVLLEPFSTLDEPVLETIMRDVRAVGSKLKVVMLPLDRNASFAGYTGLSSTDPEQPENTNTALGENQRKVIDQLKDWDLW